MSKDKIITIKEKEIIPSYSQIADMINALTEIYIAAYDVKLGYFEVVAKIISILYKYGISVEE